MNLLGLATRARKLISGEEQVLKEIRKKTAKYIFIANNASQNTQKKLIDKCEYYNISYTTAFSQAEISQAIGRLCMSCALCDAGFAKKIHELINS